MIFNWMKNRVFRKKNFFDFENMKAIEHGTICLVPSESSQMGDLIMLNHSIQQLSTTYTVLCGVKKSYFEEKSYFLEKHSLAKDFIFLPENIWQWISFILTIRKRKIKAVALDINPPINPLFFLLAGISVVIAFNGQFLFSTREYDIDKHSFHYSDRANLIRNLLCGKKQQNTIKPYFPFEKKNVKSFLNPEGISLALHIGGSLVWMRRWPITNYLKVCRLFLENYNGKIFLIGGKEEQSDNEKFKKLLNKKTNSNDRVINCSGKDLDTVASILSSSDLFLGNDSGPMHIATAIGLNVMAIFGPSSTIGVNPATYDEKNISISSDLECAPCNSPVCKLPGSKIYSCLTEVSTKSVWINLQILLKQFSSNEKINFPSLKK